MTTINSIDTISKLDLLVQDAKTTYATTHDTDMTITVSDGGNAWVYTLFLADRAGYMTAVATATIVNHRLDKVMLLSTQFLIHTARFLNAIQFRPCKDVHFWAYDDEITAVRADVRGNEPDAEKPLKLGQIYLA